MYVGGREKRGAGVSLRHSDRGHHPGLNYEINIYRIVHPRPELAKCLIIGKIAETCAHTLSTHEFRKSRFSRRTNFEKAVFLDKKGERNAENKKHREAPRVQAKRRKYLSTKPFQPKPTLLVSCVPAPLTTLLGVQSRFVDKPLKFQAFSPQHGTAALEGLRHVLEKKTPHKFTNAAQGCALLTYLVV